MLRQKYHEEDWAKFHGDLMLGDMIAFYDKSLDLEVHAEVVGFPANNGKKNLILLKKFGSNALEVLDLYNTITYKLDRVKHLKNTCPPLCECGAKHTSNPSFHLEFCPLAVA